MEVQFTPDRQAKLSRMSASQGRPEETLVKDAVDQLLRYDEWFLSEVDKGLDASDRGHFVGHEEVGTMLSARYPKG